ncbi:uncharacterized protein LOC120779655 [Bactrocera tryoni]|uniref:uncharacterized protein LOC120779655 n=1 Tax=Bactrocera tryoni TaxID=59916 RepID=UPI001A9724C8|nr:uncharacterized protein LOC120779655 [Bactrocera tryoni]
MSIGDAISSPTSEKVISSIWRAALLFIMDVLPLSITSEVFHLFEMFNERQILQWLDEVSDIEQDVAGSDSEDETVNDAVIESAHDSESEIEESEDIQNISEPSEANILRPQLLHQQYAELHASDYIQLLTKMSIHRS